MQEKHKYSKEEMYLAIGAMEGKWIDPTTILCPGETIGKNLWLLAEEIPTGKSSGPPHPRTRQWIHTCRASGHS